MPNSNSPTRMYYSGDLQIGRKCTLPPSQAHHATRVLRLKRGETVILFKGDGAEYAAVVVEANRDRVALDVTGRQTVDREAPFAVTLAQAVSSGERMDYTVQKAVELGVAAIQPLEARRGVVRLSAERAPRRIAHWQAVAIAACEQCGRNRVPPVLPLARLDAFLAAAVRVNFHLHLNVRIDTNVEDGPLLSEPRVRPASIVADANGRDAVDDACWIKLSTFSHP